MLIHKTFETSEQAGRFQFSLYQRYEAVELVKAPFFGSGIYIWRVSEEV